LNITHAKGSIVCLGAHVLPRPKEIKERNDIHVGHSLVAFGGFATKGDGQDEKKDVDGNWLHSCGGGRVILFNPVFDLALDVEVDVTGWCIGYIVPPHAGEALAYRTYDILHCARLE
jgi:hypothetical protein